MTCELSAARRQRYISGSSQVKESRPNAFTVSAFIAPDRTIAFDAIQRGFPLTGKDLRFYVRQCVSPGKYVWVLIQNPNTGITVDFKNNSAVIAMQVALRDELPYLCEVNESHWWKGLVSDAVPSQKQPVKLTKPVFSTISVQETIAKTTQGVSSVFSWAKKGIAMASDAISTTETIKLSQLSVCIVKKLADGGFSEVFQVKDTRDSTREYALKRCLAHSKSDVSDLEQEMMLHQKACSPYVMQLIDHAQYTSQRVQGAKEVMLLFPLYNCGSFNDQMQNSLDRSNAWPFPEEVAVHSIIGVLEGLKAIHKLGFAHRDIKPHNILVSAPSGLSVPLLPANFKRVKPILMDLGSAAPLTMKISDRNQGSMLVDQASVKCSAAHRAPELFDIPRIPYEVNGEKTDVWSIGTTLFAMTYGKMYSPFEHPTQGIQTLAVLQGNVSYPRSSNYSDKFKDLMQGVLQVDPDERPGVEKLLADFRSLL